MKLDDQIRAAYQIGLAAWERLLRVGATRFDTEALFNALPELRVHVAAFGFGGPTMCLGMTRALVQGGLRLGLNGPLSALAIAGGCCRRR